MIEMTDIDMVPRTIYYFAVADVSHPKNVEYDRVHSLKPTKPDGKVKVLVLCMAGIERSRMVADLLNKRGYEAVNMGAGGSTPYDPEQIKGMGFQAIVYATETVKRTAHHRLQTVTGAETLKAFGMDVPEVTLDIPDNDGVRGYIYGVDAKRYTQERVDREVTRISNMLEEHGFYDRIAEKSGIEQLRTSEV